MMITTIKAQTSIRVIFLTLRMASDSFTILLVCQRNRKSSRTLISFTYYLEISHFWDNLVILKMHAVLKYIDNNWYKIVIFT